MKLQRPINIGVAKELVPEGGMQNLQTVQAAQSQLLNTLGGIAVDYQQAKDRTKLSAAMSVSLNDYSALSAYLENSTAIDIANDSYVPVELRNEITDALGVGIKDLRNENGEAFIPAFEVRGAIHDYHLKKIRERAYGFLGTNKAMRGRYDAALNNRTATGIASIVKQNVKQERDAMSAASDGLYNAAVESGDTYQAIEIIDNAAESGLWEPSKVQEHYAKVEGDIQYTLAVNKVVSGTAGQIQRELANLGTEDNKMNAGQIADIFNKGNAVLSVKRKEREDEVNAASDEILNDIYTAQGIAGGAIPWGVLKDMRKDMTPEDYRSAVLKNRVSAAKVSAQRDDIRTVSELSTIGARLNIPQEGAPYELRKVAYLTAVHEAAGVNALTGEFVGSSKLKPETYSMLLQWPKKADDAIVNDARLNTVIDNVYRKLTGAGKDFVGTLLGEHTNRIAAAEFELDIINAALDFGPGFDAQGWSDKNVARYTPDVTRGFQSVFESWEYKKYTVRTADLIDVKASNQKVEQGLKDGELTDDQAKQIANTLDAAYKSELATKMQNDAAAKGK